MGWRGQTYRVLFDKGGFSHNANTDLAQPYDMLWPSRNINLNEGGRGSRGGTSKHNSTAVSGTPRIMGMYDYQLAQQSFLVFGTDAGNLYKDTTNTIKTGMSVFNHFNFEVFGNELFVCDGDTTPQTWDGSAASTSDITTPAADWTGSNQPFQMIAHGRGASRRMWALYGSTVYYSTLSDGKEFSGGTSGTIVVDTGDAYGLVGGVEFGDRLIVFSRKKSFVIDDSDTDKANWGYAAAQWDGGVGHWRLIAKTPTDVFCMTEYGDIYSLKAADTYGDYKQASLSRPAFVDKWIKENFYTVRIDHFHMVYDPYLRAVRFWGVRAGNQEADTCLLFFIDKPVEQAWAIHNQDNASGYNASCSTVVRESDGTQRVYTGDYDGFIWKLEQTGKNDDSAAYYSGFITPQWTMDDPRTTKLFKRGYITARPDGNYNLTVKAFVDGTLVTTASVSLAGGAYVYGTAVFDSSYYSDTELIQVPFDLGFSGQRIQFEVYNETANQDFFVSSMMVDYKPLGRRHE